MRVTGKGQVTIPKPIRDKLGIGPGSEVEFVEKGDDVHIVGLTPPADPEERRRAFDRHFARMKGTLDTMGMDGKDFIEWLRGPRDDLDPP